MRQIGLETLCNWPVIVLELPNDSKPDSNKSRERKKVVHFPGFFVDLLTVSLLALVAIGKGFAIVPKASFVIGSSNQLIA